MVSCGGGTLMRCGKWWDGSCMRVLTRCYMGGEKRILWKCLLEEEDDDATKNTVSLDKRRGTYVLVQQSVGILCGAAERLCHNLLFLLHCFAIWEVPCSLKHSSVKTFSSERKN